MVGDRFSHTVLDSAAEGRYVGEFTVVDGLPEIVVVGFAAVTHLADPWLLFGLLAAVYWFADERAASAPRRAGATAIALVTCAFAGVALGKAAAAMPRPPGADAATFVSADVPAWLPALLVGWYEGQLVASGFAFPSGHATGAVVAYGALALLLSGLWTAKRRYAVAATVAIAVALSRVVIEVHYLADVVAGVVLGGIVLGGGLWIARNARFRQETAVSTGLDPSPVFLVAIIVSIAALSVAAISGHVGEVVEAGLGIGTGLGGVIGWQFVSGSEPPVPIRIAGPVFVVAGGLWIGSVGLATTIVGGALAAIFVIIVTVVAVALVLATPAFAAQRR